MHYTTWLRLPRLRSTRLCVAWRGVFVVPRRLGPKIPGTSSTINPAVYRRGDSREGISSGGELVSVTLVSTPSSPGPAVRATRRDSAGARDDIRRGVHTRDAFAFVRARDTPLINRRYDH